METTSPADLAARLERLEARLAAVEAENAALRAAAPAAPAPMHAGPAADAPTPAPMGRRQALRGLGAAGAAAAGAVLLDGRPAAANGNPVIVGASNNGSSETSLVHTGTGGFGLHVASATVGGSAVRAAGSTSGGGLNAYGGRYHIKLERSDGRVPPVQEGGIPHQRGELVIDAYSNLWYCTADGSPGRWRTIEGNGSTGAFYPFPAPVRAYDSRPGTTPSLGPKTKLEGTRILSLRATAGVNTYANAVLLSILLVNASTAPGNFTVWRWGLPKPRSNTLVWGGSGGRFSTMAFTNVDGGGNISLDASRPTDVVVDVIGQFI